MNTDKARAAVPFCGVTERDFQGKPIKVITPASPIFTDGKRGAPRCACVSVKRTGTTLELNCETSPIGDGDSEKCLGMLKGALCYHALAAALVCAGETGHALHFYKEEEEAGRAMTGKPGARLLTLKAGYGKGKGFAVAFPPRTKTKPASKPPEEDELKPLAVSRP